MLAGLFPDYVGLVFEIECFELANVEQIIAQQEAQRQPLSDKEREEIGKFQRIRFYDKLDCCFFVDTGTGEPLICRSPCVDPSDDETSWCVDEQDYWILWCHRPDRPPHAADWQQAIACIYVEILVKSIAERQMKAAENDPSDCERRADIAEKYWRYGNDVVRETLKRTQGKQIALGAFPDPQLYKRWRQLNIDMPIGDVQRGTS